MITIAIFSAALLLYFIGMYQIMRWDEWSARYARSVDQHNDSVGMLIVVWTALIFGSAIMACIFI